MKRRSKAGLKSEKARRRRTVTLKRGNAPKIAQGRASCADDKDKKIALLIRERDEALEQQKASADILSVISNSVTDTQPVFDKILEGCKRLFGGDELDVLLVDGQGQLNIAAYIGEAHDVMAASFPAPVERTPAGRAIRERRVMHWPDLVDGEDVPGVLRKMAKLIGYRSMVFAPMLSEGHGIGAIGVARSTGPFNLKELAMLQTFADQAVIAIQNARLFAEVQSRTEDLQESLAQQTATADVLKVISFSLGELGPVFQALLENAVRLCGAKFGNLYLSEGDALRTVAFHDAPQPYVEERRRNPIIRPAPATALGRAMATKQPVQIADIQNYDPDSSNAGASGTTGVKLVQLARARTILAVPMLKENEFIGAIVIYRQEVRLFTDKQIELVENFAAQAVIAIENTRLLTELRESLQQQTATADVLKVISRSVFNLQTVLDTLVGSAARLCRADRTAIRLAKNDGLYHYVASYGHSIEHKQRMERDPATPHDGSMTGRIVREGKPVHIVDGQIDPDPDMARRTQSGNTHTILGVPLMREGIPIGVLILQRSVVQSFTDKQIEMATTFADQAVIAIENVRLFDEVQARTRELSESLEQQTGTSEVLQVISRSPGELRPVFQAMLENAVRICGAKFGMLYLSERDGFRTVAMHAVPHAFAEKRGRGPLVFPPAGESPMGRLMRTRQVAHIADIRTESGYAESESLRDLADFGGARTVVAVPMLKDNELAGAIVIYRQEVHPFTDKQIELVKNFASQAVIAIENTRLLNELRQRTDDLSESLEQQTATSEVLQAISSSPGKLEPVFHAMLESATRICAANFGNLLLYEGDGFRRVAMHNAPLGMTDVHQRNPVMSRRAAPVLDRLARTKQVIHLADVAEEVPDEPIIKYVGARTLLVVPMLKENELIGAIGIYRQEVRPFTDKQIKLVQNFADQAVIAIENARLLNELRQRTDDLTEALDQQTATSEVLKVISSSPGELEPVFSSMLTNAVRICGAKFGNLLLCEGDAFRFVTCYGAQEEYLEHRRREPVIRPRPGSDLDRVIQTKQIIHIADMQAERVAAMAAFVELTGARTLLDVPMLKENELVGVIGIYRHEVEPFTDKQIDLVSNFAAQAVIAIENARLLSELRQRTDDLSKSLEDLRTAQDRLVQTEKLASLGQLTAGIAHEIKNPLNFVNNFSGISAELVGELKETLEDVTLNENKRAEIADLTETLRSNLDKIVQHGRRADAIVKNMLLHSRQGSAEHRPVDINALVEESLNLAYHGARAERQGFNITLERSLDPAAGEADVFPQDVTRVLLNLISNGFYAATRRKAQANGGDYEPILAVSTRDLGDRVEISIRDNGNGIAPEVKEQMFNPFFTTKPAGEGTGLGLSISHDIIVKQHGGSIEVDTQPGEFTEIKIILPRSGAFSSEQGAHA